MTVDMTCVVVETVKIALMEVLAGNNSNFVVVIVEVLTGSVTVVELVTVVEVIEVYVIVGRVVDTGYMISIMIFTELLILTSRCWIANGCARAGNSFVGLSGNCELISGPGLRSMRGNSHQHRG